MSQQLMSSWNVECYTGNSEMQAEYVAKVSISVFSKVKHVIEYCQLLRFSVSN